MIGAATKTKRIELPYPHPGQIEVRQQSRRFNWLCSGRRWRKTTMCMSICVEAAVRGGVYIWGAPTYRQSRIGFEETRRAAGGMADFNESRMEVKLPGLGAIAFRSLDKPQNLRGLTADGVVTDETQYCNSAAYHEVIRPMLMDTGGWYWGIGTSNGKDWFWREREAAKRDPESMSWSAPSLGVAIEDGELVRRPHPLENPNLSFKEVLSFFKNSPRHVFRREIMSDDDAAPGGVVYDVWLDGWPERKDGNVTDAAEFLPDSGPVYWGVDDGYSAGSRYESGIDPTTRTYTPDSHPRVVGFYQMRPNGQLVRFDEIYKVKTLEEAHVKLALERGYPTPAYAAVDSSAAQLRGRLGGMGIYTRKATHRVDEGIKELRRWIAPDENGVRKLIVHPRCKHFRQEMVSYRYENETQKPAKEFDHGPDEARYLVWTLRYET